MRYRVPVAYLLWLVSGFGALGFHRFYLGKIGTGALWFCSGGLAMIGSVYDFFTLNRQVEEANFRIAYRESLLARRPVGNGAGITAPPRDTLEKTILRAAKRNKGVVTPGEVALDGDFTLEETKKALDKLAASGSAEMRVRASGVVAYVFRDFTEEGDDFVV